MKVCDDIRSGNSNRVNRGGSWNNNADNCTAGYRNYNNPDNRNNNLGFRLVSPSIVIYCVSAHNPRRIPARPSGRQKMFPHPPTSRNARPPGVFADVWKSSLS